MKKRYTASETRLYSIVSWTSLRLYLHLFSLESCVASTFCMVALGLFWFLFLRIVAPVPSSLPAGLWVKLIFLCVVTIFVLLAFEWWEDRPGFNNPCVYIFLYEFKVFLWINSWIEDFQVNGFKMFWHMLPEDTEQVVAIYIPTRNLTAIFFGGGRRIIYTKQSIQMKVDCSVSTANTHII